MTFKPLDIFLNLSLQPTNLEFTKRSLSCLLLLSIESWKERGSLNRCRYNSSIVWLAIITKSVLTSVGRIGFQFGTRLFPFLSRSANLPEVIKFYVAIFVTRSFVWWKNNNIEYELGKDFVSQYENGIVFIRIKFHFIRKALFVVNCPRVSGGSFNGGIIIIIITRQNYD